MTLNVPEVSSVVICCI